MAFTPEQIEYLHSTGQMPDWVYYQQNGRSLQENYNEIKRKNSERRLFMMMSVACLHLLRSKNVMKMSLLTRIQLYQCI